MSLYNPSLEEVNYRATTVSEANCTKCKYSDWDDIRMFGVDEALCTFFRIKIDENHVCDMLW